MKIIFMGSPEFALPSLKAIHSSNHQIIAVYTQPPRMSGRGYKENRTAIHNHAIELGLEVYTPQNFKNEEEIDKFNELNADLAIVVAYGLIIPENLLSKTKYGFINIHPSDLPKFRGAAPIQRTILSGETKTSVCIIKMDTGVDTGDILTKQEILIDEDITFTKLHDLTSKIGSDLLLQTINNIDSIIPSKQPNTAGSYASKIQKTEAKLDFLVDDLTAIDRKIRALNPSPGTHIIFENKILKIKTATFEYQKHEFHPGLIIDNEFSIACIGGILKPQIVQMEGKREMTKEEFLRGHQIAKGLQL